MPGYVDSANDAWGHPFLYTIGDDGTVTLTSRGSDRKASGTGEAAVINYRFLAKQDNGTWSDELVEWLPAAAVHPTK